MRRAFPARKVRMQKTRLLCLFLILPFCGCAAEPQAREVAVFVLLQGSPTPTAVAEPYPTPTPTPTPTPSPTPDPWLYTTHYDCGDADVLLAARVAFLEAGGRSEEAYRAVLSVIYNRCMAPRFGGGVTSIADEVYRKGQFSVIHHRNFDDVVPPDEVVDCAYDVFHNGVTNVPDTVLFFCAKRLGENWGGRKFYKNIGGNLFFHGRTGKET